MKRGIVTAIDRTNQVAYVQLLAGPVAQCAWLDYVPPPRSQVWVQDVSTGGAGAFVVMGMVGNRQFVFHEDWTIIPNGSTNYTSTAQQLLNGDTQWRVLPKVASVNVGASEGAAQGVGGITITSGSTGLGQAIAVCKGGVATGTTNNGQYGIWLSGRATANNWTSMAFTIALANDTAYLGAKASGDRFVGLIYDTAATGTVRLQTGIDTNVTYVDSGFVPSVNAWFDFDVMLVAGTNGWAAMWINGNGPYKSTTNIPAVNIPLPVEFAVYNQTSAQRQLAIDYLRVELVSPVSPI